MQGRPPCGPGREAARPPARPTGQRRPVLSYVVGACLSTHLLHCLLSAINLLLKGAVHRLQRSSVRVVIASQAGPGGLSGNNVVSRKPHHTSTQQAPAAGRQLEAAPTLFIAPISASNAVCISSSIARWIAWRSKPLPLLLLPLLRLPLLVRPLPPAATAPLVVVAAEALLLLAAVSTDTLRELSPRPKLVLCHVGRRCRRPVAGRVGQGHGDERAPPPAAPAAGAQPPQLPQLPRCSMLHGALLCLVAPRTRP